MECSKMESIEDSKESGVSLKSDRSQCFKILSSLRVHLESLQSAISCASAERDDSQGCTAHVKETPPSPKEKMPLRKTQFDPVTSNFLIPLRQQSPVVMAKRSMESIDSGVSLKSDWSKDGLIDFKDRVSLSRSDLSLLSMNSVAHRKDWVKSSDDLMPRRRIQFDPVTSNFLIPLSQQSPVVMATRSFEAFGSSLSSMNDSVIRNRQRFLPRMVLRSMDTFGSSVSLISDSFIGTGQRSPPREELNQELSSEVGWEHR